MIIGIGVDVVDVERFGAELERVPRLRQRLFTPVERDLPIRSLAARFAAKEALAKALGSPGGMFWQDSSIAPTRGKCPTFDLTGSVAKACDDRGVTTVHLSMSHDGPIAQAFVVLEGDAR